MRTAGRKEPMKRFQFVLVTLLVFIMLLSACAVNTPTPPLTEAESTSTGASVGMEELGTPLPTIELPPTPTPDTRLFDEENRMICTIYEPMFPPLSDEEKEAMAGIGEVTDADHIRGNPDAILTVMEYSDFQCSACKVFYDEIEKFAALYPDEVRLVFRNFPLVSLHPNATMAAQAAEAAALQGKYWEMYNLLFSKQSEWSTLGADTLDAWLKEAAAELGLDKKFNEDLISQEITDKVQSDLEEAMTAGLNQTPTVFLNGRYWPYNWDVNTLSMVLKVVQAEKNLETECPPYTIDQEKEYFATIELEHGDVVIELFPKQAPMAVNSFVYLARKGFYDGVTFHRVMHDFVAQAGDPSGTGISGSGYEFREEVVSELTFDKEGVVGAAKTTMPNTSGSQFFITYGPAPELDGGYTIFGQVVSGMDVVKQITERDPQANPDVPEGDKIITITIEEK
jgi:cyclophilin family peptidyl-prolyl cis-trans isomerase/protein-disulfide isomerase